MPYPKYVYMNEDTQHNQMPLQPCLISYIISNSGTHFDELIEHQQYKSFACHDYHISTQMDPNQDTEYTVEIKVMDPTLRSPLKIEEEKYTLSITKERTVITADYYPGVVRGLETFIQAVQCHRFSV